MDDKLLNTSTYPLPLFHADESEEVPDLELKL